MTTQEDPVSEKTYNPESNYSSTREDTVDHDRDLDRMMKHVLDCIERIFLIGSSDKSAKKKLTVFCEALTLAKQYLQHSKADLQTIATLCGNLRSNSEIVIDPDIHKNWIYSEDIFIDETSDSELTSSLDLAEPTNLSLSGTVTIPAKALLAQLSWAGTSHCSSISFIGVLDSLCSVYLAGEYCKAEKIMEHVIKTGGSASLEILKKLVTFYPKILSQTRPWSNGGSALHVAAEFNNDVELLKYLHHLDPSAMEKDDSYGLGPLHLLVFSPKSEVSIEAARFLVEADPESLLMTIQSHRSTLRCCQYQLLRRSSEAAFISPS
jgi:hypothetical protein